MAKCDFRLIIKLLKALEEGPKTPYRLHREIHDLCSRKYLNVYINYAKEYGLVEERIYPRGNITSYKRVISLTEAGKELVEFIKRRIPERLLKEL